MRAKIAERAVEYEKIRQPSVASNELTIFAFGTGRSKGLVPGECMIDFDEMDSSE
jgi:hypothetical protein